MGVYLLINVAYLFAMTAPELGATPTPAADVANILWSRRRKANNNRILVSIFGALNGYIMTGMRIPYAMAAENKLPFSEFFQSFTRNLEHL